MNETEGKWVNTLLDPEMAERFEAIKRYHGVKASGEMIRILIQKEVRRLFETGPLSLNAHQEMPQ